MCTETCVSLWVLSHFCTWGGALQCSFGQAQMIFQASQRYKWQGRGWQLHHGTQVDPMFVPHKLRAHSWLRKHFWVRKLQAFGLMHRYSANRKRNSNLWKHYAVSSSVCRSISNKHVEGSYCCGNFIDRAGKSLCITSLILFTFCFVLHTPLLIWALQASNIRTAMTKIVWKSWQPKNPSGTITLITFTFFKIKKKLKKKASILGRKGVKKYLIGNRRASFLKHQELISVELAEILREIIAWERKSGNSF